jgi:GNAT superfamily N-acetyltransferase
MTPVARRLAKRLLAPLVWRETYRCLRLPWHERATPPASAPFEVRVLDRSDLAHYSREARYEISARFLDGIAARDDLCVAAFSGNDLVSYRFFAAQPTDVEAHLRFHFPPGWIYAYKAFTHPSWRGRRLHRELFLGSLPEIERWQRGSRNPLGFVTLVMSDNESSAKALARVGFEPFTSFSVLRVLSRPRRVTPEDEAMQFRITVQ